MTRLRVSMGAALLAFASALGCGDVAPRVRRVAPADASAPAPVGETATVDAAAPPGEVDAATPPPPPPPPPDPNIPGWNLVWSDEFDGPVGGSVDLRKWTLESGGTGWGNGELQYYTDRIQNAFLDGSGVLVIKAYHEAYKGKSYTSARLKTQGLFSQAYGRFEARAKLPYGQGLWPAFWLLGDNFPTAGWPQCGEIDIMENVGRLPTINHGSLHGPGYSADKAVTAQYTLPGGRKFSDDYHVFAIEWEPNTIRFYVDGELYVRRTPANLPPGTTWVYDHPHFIILNIAIGGTFPKYPDSTTVFPQSLFVDYVRVYKR